MPIPPESLVKIYRANRNLGTSRPVIVAVGDTMVEGIPFYEYYVFHSFSDVAFLYSRSVCGSIDEWNPVDFGQYPEIFSAKALLASSFRSAQDRLEFEVSMHDREWFRSAATLSFDETDDSPLIEFRVFQNFSSECAKMFGFSRATAIHALRDKIEKYPNVKLIREPKD
ncbi:MAG TPA: hypothetical protein VMF08_01325 [Candidatus Sulfotelmatobacter sp.]|nr:hypothetical protein [Candidatus Sulfotelmatobacter sp.]